MHALNSASLALGAPMLTSLAGGYARTPAAGRLVPAAAAGFSTDSSEDDGERDDPLLTPFPRGQPRADSLRAEAWAQARATPPLVRGAVIVTRSLIAVAVAPVRVSAALVILPFALVIHGVAATGGALRCALFGGRRRRLPLERLHAASEEERRSGEASNPEKRNLMNRFLCDLDCDLDSTGADAAPE